jgi:hypothetical protein
MVADGALLFDDQIAAVIGFESLYPAKTSYNTRPRA